MPELPEVEAVIRKLRKARISGVRIAAFRSFRPRATYPQTPARLEEAQGHSIRKFERRGKHIVVRLDGGLSLDIHLGMAGNLHAIPDARLHTNTLRALFTLEDGRGLAYEDRRMLGHVNLWTDAELEKRLKHVGVDPMSEEFTPELLKDAAKGSVKPIKVFLMEQWPVSGLGNIYSAEALFRARIHPAKAAGSLRAPRLTALHAAIQETISIAVPEAIRWYTEPDKHEGMTYNVYGRGGEQCSVCGRPIRKLEQAGRSTYYCGTCQR